MTAAAELQRTYRELTNAGASPMRRREAYNDWFRARCAEGRPPDALALFSRNEAERFWARTVPGPDGHIYWTAGKAFYTNDRKHPRPQRWAWTREHGPLTRFQLVEPSCGERNCVNVDHLALVAWGDRRQKFSDRAAFGAVQVLALRLGRTPRSDEWDAAGLPVTYGAMANRFGTWNRFLIAAGLKPNPPNRTVPDAVCAAAVRALSHKLGHLPTEYDWNRHRDWLRARDYPTSPDTLGVARRLQRPGNRWVVKR